MEIRDQWPGEATALAPVADLTGPFPHQPFLECWWEHRAAQDDRMVIAQGDAGLVFLVERGDRIELAGEEDLVDYHTPLGAGVPELFAEFMGTLASGTRFRFDSLPAEAADVVAKGLHSAGITIEPVEHAMTAVLDLPDTVDDWLAAIGKKERHEVRRKGRRFASEIGAPVLRRSHDEEAVAAFADMHRRASGDKGEFMDSEMEAFFAGLAAHAGGVVDFLYGDAPEPVAAAFGFEDEQAYYLYNSAYEPAAGHASPGIVLLAELIGATIGTGRRRFDFLKGDETYKFRHGAEPRALFVLEGTTP